MGVDLTSYGSGYKTAPKVIVSDPSYKGSGANLKSIINDNGQVVQVVPIEPGNGYLSSPDGSTYGAGGTLSNPGDTVIKFKTKKYSGIGNTFAAFVNPGSSILLNPTGPGVPEVLGIGVTVVINGPAKNVTIPGGTTTIDSLDPNMTIDKKLGGEGLGEEVVFGILVGETDSPNPIFGFNGNAGANSGSFVGDIDAGSNTITNVTSVTGKVNPGQLITMSNAPANIYLLVELQPFLLLLEQLELMLKLQLTSQLLEQDQHKVNYS